MKRQSIRNGSTWPLSAIVLLLAAYNFGTLNASEGKVIPLSKADREYIEKHLGPGVVGKPVAAKPIGDVQEFLKMGGGRVTIARYTHGDNKGKMERINLTPIKRRSGARAWKRKIGQARVQYGQLTKDGSLRMYAIADNEEGVITRYSPNEPILLKGLPPGGVEKKKINVTVSDLTSTDEISYRGYLDMVYQYVGAYEVTVPMGKFEAILLKWQYKGEIGPANVEDRQYIFIAPGVGAIAAVYQTDASAFLVYQRHTKAAAVAVRTESR